MHKKSDQFRGKKSFSRDSDKRSTSKDSTYKASRPSKRAEAGEDAGKPGRGEKSAERGYRGDGDREQTRYRGNDSDKPYKRSEKPERKFGDGGKRTFEKRETGERDSFRGKERKPFDRKDSGDKKPYRKSEGAGKSFGDRARPAFEKREEGGYKKTSFRDNDRKPFDNKEGDERKPYKRTERPGRKSDDRPKRPFENREGGERRRSSYRDSDSRPFDNKEGDERKPYKRTERPGRKVDDRPKRPFEKREGGEHKRSTFRDKAPGPFDRKEGGERKPYKKSDRPERGSGEGAKPSFKRSRPGDTEERRPARSYEDRRDWDDDDNDYEDPKTPAARDSEFPMPLNKYIAHSGECSRRDAAELVKQGKVKVNGELVLEPGRKVEYADKITLSGKKLTPQKGRMYVLLNKPKGYITTNDDPKGRRTVMDLVSKSGADRLYPVGRLDRNTTGLLLLTNDGDLAQKLAHPSFEVKKVYYITLDKSLTEADFDKIKAGVTLEDGIAKVDDLAYLETKSELGLEIHSGKNRIVRRIFESLGYVVEKLDRVMYAGLTKKNLPRGKWRKLDEREIVLLKHFKS
jgi:23S rRNA pseudouridine2605 synthase